MQNDPKETLFPCSDRAVCPLTACSGGGKSDEVEITLPASLFMGDVDAAV